MVLLFLVIIGIAAFCFIQGYNAPCIICLLGFSGKIGFIALAVTSILLFYNGHWIIGVVPLVPVGINLLLRNKNKNIDIME